MKYWYLIYLLVFSLSGFSQSERLKHTLKTAYKFEKTEDYLSAKKALLVYLKEKNSNNSEINFAKNQVIFYDYLLSDSNSISGINQSIESILPIRHRKSYETEFLLKLFIQKQLYEANSTTFENALIIAEQGFKIQDFEQATSQTKITYLLELGKLYRECFNPFKGIFFIEKSIALNIAFNGENNLDLADSYNILGDAYLENYNPVKGNECYKKAITILEKTNDNKPENIDILLEGYRNLIRNLVAYGAHSDAEKYNNKVNKLFSEHKLKLQRFSKALYFHSRQMQVQSNVVFNAVKGNFDVATSYCDSLKSETKFNTENIDAIKFVISRYYDVIDYMYESEKYELTIKKAHELLPIINKYDLVVLKMLVNAKLGTSYEKQKDYKKALQHILIAEEIVDQQNFNSSKFSIQIIKAIILGKMNKNNQATDIGKKTLEQLVFEKTKTKIEIQDIKFENVRDLSDTYFINIFEKVAEIYLNEFKKHKKPKDIQIAENLYKIAGKLFQEYYLKGEFNDYLSYYHLRIVEGILECTLLKNATFEQITSNITLIESNASQHLLKEFEKKIKRTPSLTSNYLTQINTLKTELEYYKKQKTNIKTELIFNTNKIKLLQQNINQLSATISKTEKNYENFNKNDVNIKEVLSFLKKNEQLVKYYVCNTKVYAVIFSNNTIEIKRIGDKNLVENELKKYVSQTSKIQLNFKRAACKLYSFLIPFNLKTKVTIIPDSFINYLPFETLYDQKSEQYIVENHLLSYTYSLPMWLLHQKISTKSNNQKLAAFAPFYTKTSQSISRSDFKNLKFANVESQRIVQIFEGTLFTKNKATKANFIKEKDNFNIFHLSMHSQLFENDFNQSCLVFSNNEKLYFSELYGMNIPASMIVLSACDTGNGSLKNGEGIMSMSRALTYAGVKSAVVSLWQVPDKETSEIMISFYENLILGQTKDAALANAKRNFIKNNPMKNQPFYWAGFIVNGDISPVIATNYNWLWYLGIGLAGLILMTIFRKKLF